MFTCCQSDSGVIDIQKNSDKGNMDRWSNKVAMVTGATSGIGAAVCKTLVENGMIVVGLGRRSHKIQEMSAQLQNEPGKLHAFKCDLAQEENILKAFKWTLQNFGPVCVLVNNAGITVPSTLADGSTEDWRKVLDLNVTGLCICTREAIKQMNERNINEGHIININSIVGHFVPKLSIPTLNIYPASKHAVTALSESLRQEMRFLKKSIKVTSISPGLVQTEWLNGLTPEVKSDLSQPETPILQSENIAEAVLFTLSTPPNVEVTELTIRPLGDGF